MKIPKRKNNFFMLTECGLKKVKVVVQTIAFKIYKIIKLFCLFKIKNPPVMAYQRISTTNL
ncbi:MAG: hypothetical protein CUR32_02880 [Flavobacterium sp.]|nr:MAG: hypothetical protein CUR32_02880 [Flavobacterium sp.] [Flavobacterium sp. FEMGT703F]